MKKVKEVVLAPFAAVGALIALAVTYIFGWKKDGE